MSAWRTPRVRALLLLAIIGSVAGAATIAAHIYTELLWFSEVGHERVLWTTLRWKLVADWLFPLATSFLVLANLAVVDRVLVDHSRTGAVHERVRRLWPYRRMLYPCYAVLCGVVVSN